jgi:hypothetical protein
MRELIFGALRWHDPYRLIEVKFHPTHSSHFLAPLAREEQ